MSPAWRDHKVTKVVSYGASPVAIKVVSLLVVTCAHTEASDIAFGMGQRMNVSIIIAPIVNAHHLHVSLYVPSLRLPTGSRPAL